MVSEPATINHPPSAIRQQPVGLSCPHRLPKPKSADHSEETPAKAVDSDEERGRIRNSVILFCNFGGVDFA